ncbi:MAG: LTA synthase family protein [Proteobacteria bacterium]|nr:LTA synthase family protein [Pseudomonadota bacterium]
MVVLPPTMATWLHVCALTLPLAASVVGAKLQKLGMATSRELELAEGLRACADDLLFCALWTLGWVLVLALVRGSTRYLAAGLLHLSNLLLMLWTVVEHGFHVATGSLLDWYMVSYAADNFAALQSVIASEVQPVAWLCLLLAALYHAGLPALARIGLLRGTLQRLSAQERWSNPWQLLPISVLGVVLLLGGLHSGGALDDDILPLRRNTFATLASELHSTAAATETQHAGDYTQPPPLRIYPTRVTKKHNVVLVILESARARSCTPYSPRLTTTPNLARLAARGLLIEHFYTVVPHTSKALVSLHCGIYPKIVTRIAEAGTDALPARCLATLLREQGYATAFFQPAERSFERRHDLVASFGFEHFIGKEDLSAEGFEKVGYFGYEDDAILEPVLEWIDRQRGPFLLNVLTLTAHHPYKLPKSFPRQHFADKKKLDNYLNALAYTDRFLGKLFAGFEQRGLLTSTFFVILGDHGEGFGEHKRYQHDNVIYEEGLHSPMLLLGAGLDAATSRAQRPRRVLGLRQMIDVVPTVLDVLGYEHRGGDLPGKSLLSSSGHNTLYFSCWYKNRCLALRDGFRKTIYHYGRRGVEVFDLVGDPGEERNLIGLTPLIRLESEAAVEELLAWKRLTNARYERQSVSQRDRAILRERPSDIQHTLEVRFGDSIELIGYDIEKRSARLGEPVVVTYYFHVTGPITRPWSLFVHLLGEHGTLINRDHVPLEGAYPIEAWQTGEYIVDQHILRVPPQKPAGKYRILLGLWDKSAGRGVEARAEISGHGATIDAKQRLNLGTFDVSE